MKEKELHNHALYIVFLFLKSENNHFIKEIKSVISAFIVWWKPWQSLREFSSGWKISTVSQVFTDLLSNSPKRSPRFSRGYEGTERLVYILNINLMFKRAVHNLTLKLTLYSFRLFLNDLIYYPDTCTVCSC